MSGFSDSPSPFPTLNGQYPQTRRSPPATLFATHGVPFPTLMQHEALLDWPRSCELSASAMTRSGTASTDVDADIYTFRRGPFTQEWNEGTIPYVDPTVTSVSPIPALYAYQYGGLSATQPTQPLPVTISDRQEPTASYIVQHPRQHQQRNQSQRQQPQSLQHTSAPHPRQQQCVVPCGKNQGAGIGSAATDRLWANELDTPTQKRPMKQPATRYTGVVAHMPLRVPPLHNNHSHPPVPQSSLPRMSQKTLTPLAGTVRTKPSDMLLRKPRADYISADSDTSPSAVNVPPITSPNVAYNTYPVVSSTPHNSLPNNSKRNIPLNSMQRNTQLTPHSTILNIQPCTAISQNPQPSGTSAHNAQPAVAPAPHTQVPLSASAVGIADVGASPGDVPATHASQPAALGRVTQPTAPPSVPLQAPRVNLSQQPASPQPDPQLWATGRPDSSPRGTEPCAHQPSHLHATPCAPQAHTGTQMLTPQSQVHNFMQSRQPQPVTQSSTPLPLIQSGVPPQFYTSTPQSENQAPSQSHVPKSLTQRSSHPESQNTVHPLTLRGFRFGSRDLGNAGGRTAAGSELVHQPDGNSRQAVGPDDSSDEGTDFGALNASEISEASDAIRENLFAALEAADVAQLIDDRITADMLGEDCAISEDSSAETPRMERVERTGEGEEELAATALRVVNASRAEDEDALDKLLVLPRGFQMLTKLRYDEDTLRALCSDHLQPPRNLHRLKEIFVPPRRYVDKKRRKTVCLDWLKGKCDEKRWKCKFAHPALPELPATEMPNSHVQSVQIPTAPPSEGGSERREICDVWRLTGSCKFGSFCWFGHPAIRTRKGLLTNPSTNGSKQAQSKKGGTRSGTVGQPKLDAHSDLSDFSYLCL